LNDVLTSIVNLAVGRMLASRTSVDRRAFDAIKAPTMERIHRALCVMLGTPPVAFANTDGPLQGTPGGAAPGRQSKGTTKSKGTTTPLDYYRGVVRPCMDPSGYVCLISDPRRPDRTGVSTQYTSVVVPDAAVDLSKHAFNKFFNVSLPCLKDACVKALAAKHPVWFSCDVQKYYDPEALLLNAKASNIDLLTGDDEWKLPKAALYQSGAIQNSHAMTLVGYDEAEKRWKVENSWGSAAATVMTDAWFDKFVVSAVVPLRSVPADLRSRYARIVASGDFHMLPVWDIYSSPQKN